MVPAKECVCARVYLCLCLCLCVSLSGSLQNERGIMSVCMNQLNPKTLNPTPSSLHARGIIPVCLYICFWCAFWHASMPVCCIFFICILTFFFWCAFWHFSLMCILTCQYMPVCCIFTCPNSYLHLVCIIPEGVCCIAAQQYSVCCIARIVG